MSEPHTHVRRCVVYQGRGEPFALSIEHDATGEAAPRDPTIADLVPLREIRSRDLICARADLEIRALVLLMIEHHVGCIPVVDERRGPIGVVTKLDLVELLAATGEGGPTRTAEDVMMPLVLTLDENSTVAEAAAMMSVEDLHHVLLTSAAGTISGVVSSKDIVDWLVRNDGLGTRAQVGMFDESGENMARNR